MQTVSKEKALSLLEEFREFIAKGNVMDLAVGVIIGGAFGKIVTSLVDHVIMPPIGLILGKVDFSDLKLVLSSGNPKAKIAEVAIAYGAFVNTVVQFLIIAFVVFSLIKAINSVRRHAGGNTETPAPPTRTEALLAEIRDLLKAR